MCVALWGVNDPGNVGTVLRSALAFGASSVALGPGTADPYGPKAVRASMGAIFAVPVVRVANVGELPGRKVALAARSGRRARRGSTPREVTLVVGAEREGLPDGRARELRRDGPHPDPVRVAQRGDGGDDRPLRSH